MQTKIGSLAIFVAIASSVTSVYASEKSPYDSGYDHGCDDADLDADDRYINEPGKGKAHHTDEFNDGYDEGFSDCGDGDGGDSGDDDSDSGSDGNNNRDDLAQRLCDTVDENRVVAAGIALALGYPGLDVAVSALCEISGN